MLPFNDVTNFCIGTFPSLLKLASMSMKYPFLYALSLLFLDFKLQQMALMQRNSGLVWLYHGCSFCM
jgi:hypothetical protein